MIKSKECRYGPMMYPDNDRWMGFAFDNYGEALFHQVDFLRSLVRPGDVVVDAGAHIGTMTVPLGQKVGKNGYVISFEPQQFLHYVLCGNIALNNLYHVVATNRALGDTDGQNYYIKDLDYEQEQNFGSLSLSEHEQHYGDKLVKTTTLDSLRLSQLNLFKIDVEGMGTKVLEGARETIKRCQPYIFIESMPGNPVEVAQTIESLGYKWAPYETPYFNEDNYENNTEDLLRNTERPDMRMVSCDFFCFPKESESDVRPILDAKPFFIDVLKSDLPRHQALKEYVVNDRTSICYSQ